MIAIVTTAPLSVLVCAQTYFFSYIDIDPWIYLSFHLSFHLSCDRFFYIYIYIYI